MLLTEQHYCCFTCCFTLTAPCCFTCCLICAIDVKSCCKNPDASYCAVYHYKTITANPNLRLFYQPALRLNRTALLRFVLPMNLFLFFYTLFRTREPELNRALIRTIQKKRKKNIKVCNYIIFLFYQMSSKKFASSALYVAT